ncbi:ESX secretion-associated protein EspG [Umezawaea sp. NPDC059074]|uniref:ESX secretion-associated protein EspG n=1 Tax=Umezawaea sp. NPDC059074 TaxID=3346716 RepID=UPI0036897D2F
MLRSRVVLPVAALYNAWQAAGLPELHRALYTRIDFDSDSLADGDLTGAMAVFEGGWTALERLGLGRGRTVHPDLGRSLRLIAEAGTEYYAYFNHGDEEPRTALVAVSGEEAIRVVLTPDKHFVLEPVRAEDGPSSLVAVLPEAAAGKGALISLPADALAPKPRHQREESDGFLQQNRYATTPQEQQVIALRKLLAEPRVGGGQLYAARRDRFGRKVRCPKPLTFFDTAAGRYLQYQVSSNGLPWNTVQPADFGAMTSRLAMLPSTIPIG